MRFYTHTPFLLLLFFLQSTFTLCQTAPRSVNRIRAIYQLDYKLDSVVTTPKRAHMILRVSNGFSRFEGVSRYIWDSLYVNRPDLPYKERNSQAFNGVPRRFHKNEFQYTILKEPAKAVVAYHDVINLEDYQYLENSQLFKWRITAASKNIAGYECQQAYTTFGGRTWEAWFTRAVPVSDGPYKFYGLPGLIVQIRDTHDHYVFTLTCLDTHPTPFDATTENTITRASVAAPVISRTKFEKAKLDDELTFVDRIIAHGNAVPEGLREQHLQMIKRRNNPLERK